MLTWPHRHTDWASDLANVEACYLELAYHICRYQKLLIVCFDHAHKKHIKQILKEKNVALEQVRLALAPSNDTWTRDHGPIAVLCQQDITLLDFRFNGWGGKYASDLDHAITATLYHQQALGDTVLEPISMVLEGGSIEVDGSGTLLTTRDCLLSPTRNPKLSQQQIEQKLIQWFGLSRVLWLGHGYLDGDDTDSHIDILARFCDRETIVYTHCDDKSDPHYKELNAMETELRGLRSITDQPYRLLPLPWPAAKYDEAGKRLAASYANFLVINGAIIMPGYNDPADEQARICLQQCFPDREVIAINALPLIKQGGSLHCMAMQLPEGVLT
ncbi:MAG: agmatine deiminase family protein [Gammaproteobacteria bacterium]|nr:MAG: agmatine deiminase family protein [Gammaproteobacteria bacterium]